MQIKLKAFIICVFQTGKRIVKEKKYAISIYKKIAQDKPELKQIGNMKKSIKCNTLNIVVSGKFDTCR